MLRFILIVLSLLILWIIYMSKKFYNPYRLTMVFGKKGAGKTTLLTKLSIKYNKMGYHVFSNVEIFGCYHLDTNDIGFKDLPGQADKAKKISQQIHVICKIPKLFVDIEALGEQISNAFIVTL